MHSMLTTAFESAALCNAFCEQEAALNSQQAEGEMDVHQDATSIANRVLEQLGAEMRLPDEPGSQLTLAPAPQSFAAAPLFADAT